jgi:hypothetical protein
MKLRSRHLTVQGAAYGLLACLLTADAAAQTEPGKPVDVRAAAAFEEMVPVLRHPRCINCHSAGDFPRQGIDSHQHTMQVRRGPDGQGVNAVKCSTCHQEHNLAGYTPRREHRIGIFPLLTCR